MPLGPNTLKMAKVWYQGPTQPVASTRLSSTCLRCNLRDDATCTTRRCASASLQARLGNPSQTCFHAKQATKWVQPPPLLAWHAPYVPPILKMPTPPHPLRWSTAARWPQSVHARTASPSQLGRLPGLGPPGGADRCGHRAKGRGPNKAHRQVPFILISGFCLILENE
jgi:hypothetical protein